MKTGLKLLGLIVGLLTVMMLMLSGSVFADTPDETEIQGQSAGYDGNGVKGEEVASPNTVTDLLGLTSEECRVLCSEGNSLADIASKQGVTTDALIEAIITEQTALVQAEVADGSLTQEQADFLMQLIVEQVEITVNGVANCGDGSSKSASSDSSEVATGGCCPK